jgi:hypothetical protein
MTPQTSPEMPRQPTADVSEDADVAVEETGVFDPFAKLNESAYTQNLRLIAENTHLRLRIMALENELAAAKGRV